MIKSYYISPMRANAMIEETMTGKFIKVGDYTYYEVSRPPRGRRVFKKLRSLDEKERIVIYT